MEENSTNVAATTNETETKETSSVKTFTEDEVMKLIQSESDRRVSQALKKQEKEYNKKLSLSQLDETARGEAEKDMRIQELEEKLKEFSVLQNKNEITKTLSARGLNPAFADLIEIGEDVEEAQKKIESLDKMFKQAVADEVKKRLAGNTPKDAGSPAEMTKEDFRKLTLKQQTKLYNENPELFKRLSAH